MVIHDLRDFTTDRHRSVDDVPYGGGPGMVMKPEPIFRALDAIEARRGAAVTVLLMSPQGTRFTQADAERLGTQQHVVLLCGRYEGVDERVRSRVDEEVSIGDYVLSGGELPALVVLDAVARFVPGVVGDDQSVAEDSFSRGLLDFPHYTRPAVVGDLTGARRAVVGQSRGNPAVAETGISGEGRSSGGRTCWRARRSMTKNEGYSRNCRMAGWQNCRKGRRSDCVTSAFLLQSCHSAILQW